MHYGHPHHGWVGESFSLNSKGLLYCIAILHDLVCNVCYNIHSNLTYKWKGDKISNCDDKEMLMALYAPLLLNLLNPI